MHWPTCSVPRHGRTLPFHRVGPDHRIAPWIGRINRTPERFQKLVIGHLRGVESDLQGFPVSGRAACDVPVGGVRGGSARVSRYGLLYPRNLVEVRFDAPEASSRERRDLRGLGQAEGTPMKKAAMPMRRERFIALVPDWVWTGDQIRPSTRSVTEKSPDPRRITWAAGLRARLQIFQGL